MGPREGEGKGERREEGKGKRGKGKGEKGRERKGEAGRRDGKRGKGRRERRGREGVHKFRKTTARYQMAGYWPDNYYM